MNNEKQNSKNTAETLREIGNKYMALVETTHTGYVILDSQGRVVEANAEYIKLSGHETLEQIRGRNVIEWTAPYDMDSNAAAVDRCVRQGYINNFLVDYIDQKGNATPIEIHASVIKVGLDYQIVSICRDITERKQAERQLSESRDYFRNIINAIGDPVFVKDDQFRFVDVNDALCEILGKARQDLIGKTGIEFLPKAEMDHFLDIDRKVLLSGEKNLCEENLTTSGGKVSTIVTRKTRYVSPAGKKFIVGVIRDITERKMAEALQASEALFRTLYEEAPISYQSLDVAGNYLYVNKMWLTTMGYEKKEVIGKKFDDFLSGNWSGAFKESFSRFKSEGQISGVEFELSKKDGSAILIELTGKIAHDDQGNFKQAHCVFQDITKRKIMEKEIIDKVNDLESFTKVVVDRELKMKELEDKIRRLEGTK